MSRLRFIRAGSWNKRLCLVSGCDLIQTRDQFGFPLLKRVGRIHIAIDPVAESICAQRRKLGVEVAAKLAEMLVVAVTESENSIGEIFKAGKMFEAEFLIKRLHAIRRFAVAICAGKDKGISFRRQRCWSVSHKRRDGR